MEKLFAFFIFILFFGNGFGTQIILASDPCPSGWKYISQINSCYFMPKVLLPFEDAQDYCRNVTTGELVTVYGQTEYDQLMTIMKTHSSSGLYPFWINMIPDIWYPYWMWADGTEANYTKWYNNTRPRDDKSCIAWRTTSNDDGWIPMNCKYSQPFICKQASQTCPTVLLNGTTGNLTSPNYPRPYPLDSNCVYHIIVPAGNIVRFSFDYVDLDYLDKFIFYDGPDMTAPKLATVYDESDITDFHWDSSGNTLTLQFYTSTWSYYGPGEGWKAHFVSQTEPSPTMLNGTSGTLTSPNYPQNYNNSLALRYQYIVAPGMIIQLTITDFITEASYDWLLIFDGLYTTSPTLLNWSGNHTTDCPFNLRSSSNSIYLFFHTDSSITKTGFSLNYQLIPESK